MIQVAIIPANAKGDSMFSFLAPLLEELRWMQDNLTQMTGIDGKQIQFNAHLLLATGDIPGAAVLCGHAGHQSIFGCRICIAEATSLISSAGKGKGRYFHDAGRKLKERRIEDYVEGDKVSLQCKTGHAVH